MIPKEEENEKEPPCHSEEGRIVVKEKASHLCGEPHHPFHPAPTVVKNRILDTDSFDSQVQMSSGNMVENILIEYKINSPFSQFKIRKKGVKRVG